MSLLIHFLLTSIALTYDLLLPSYVARPVLCMPSVTQGVYHHMSLPLFPLVMCMLACSLKY